MTAQNHPTAQELKSAIFSVYNKAVVASKTNPELETNRVHRGMGLAMSKALIGKNRPYNTTIKTCNCPDNKRTFFICKHRVAVMIETRANELLRKKAKVTQLQDAKEYREFISPTPAQILLTSDQVHDAKREYVEASLRELGY